MQFLSWLKLKTNPKRLELRREKTSLMSSKKIIEKLDPKKVSGKFDMSTNVLKKMQLFSPSTSAMVSML